MEIWKSDDVRTESPSHQTEKFSDCDGTTTVEWQNDTQPWLWQMSPTRCKIHGDQSKKELGWNGPTEEYIHHLPSEQWSSKRSISVENNFIF